MKCIWCGKIDEDVSLRKITNKDGEKIEFLSHPEHIPKVQAYLTDSSKHKSFFIGMAIGLSLFLLLISTIAPQWMMGIPVIVQGIILWVMPYSTPTTTHALGIKRSKALVRAASVMLIVIGLLIVCKII